MSHRSAAHLAWSLWGLFAALQAVIVWQAWDGPTRSGDLFGMLRFGFATVGALVASRRPGNSVGWLLIAVALAFTVQSFSTVYVRTPSHPGYVAVAWFADLMWYVGFVPPAILLLVFPNGRLPSSRWQAVVWLGATALAASIVGTAFGPGELSVGKAVQNSLGTHGTAAEVMMALAVLAQILILVFFLLAASSLIVRFRRSRGVERQQLKWFTFASLLTVGGLAVAVIGELLPGAWRQAVAAVGWTTFLFALLIGIPAATGIAILRHQLYDIDVVINRTLVYGALTLSLAVAYLGSVLMLRLLLSPLTGESDLAVAGSTLAVAALFRPARARIQTVVDQRFYRARYDAKRTLEAFSARLRDELDLEALGTDLRTVVHDTMQPRSVSLWVRP